MSEYWIALSFHQNFTVFGDRWVFNWEIFSNDSYQIFPFYSWENMDIGWRNVCVILDGKLSQALCQIFRYPFVLPWTKRQCMVSCFLTFLLYFGICDMNTKTHINPCSESCQNWTLFRLLEHSSCHARARVSNHCYRSFVRRGRGVYSGKSDCLVLPKN